MASAAPRHLPSGGQLKRHIASKGSRSAIVLAPSHRAVRNSGTLFPNRVTDPADAPRMLIDGVNSRKIGKMVVKGRWAGMPILTLTLEEKATCPTTCREWANCYGNAMNWARRLRHGPALESALRDELIRYASRYPLGFVVRLHVLGDFYSLDYVRFWTSTLLALPALRLFGFTAWQPDTPIGRAVARMNIVGGDRCWIRTSGSEGKRGSIVVDRAQDTHQVICPAQTGATDCCGTCGLCWTMPAPIAFVRH